MEICREIYNRCAGLVDTYDNRVNSINLDGTGYDLRVKHLDGITIILDEDFCSDDRDDFFSLHIFNKDEDDKINSYIEVNGDKGYIKLYGYKNNENGTVKEVNYVAKGGDEYIEAYLEEDTPKKVDPYLVMDSISSLSFDKLFERQREYKLHKIKTKKGTH